MPKIEVKSTQAVVLDDGFVYKLDTNSRYLFVFGKGSGITLDNIQHLNDSLYERGINALGMVVEDIDDMRLLEFERNYTYEVRNDQSR